MTATWTDNNSRLWEVIGGMSSKDTPKGKLSAFVVREIASGIPDNLKKIAVAVEAETKNGTVKRLFDVASEEAGSELIRKQGL